MTSASSCKGVVALTSRSRSASARQLSARTSAPSARPACSARACFHCSTSAILEAKLFFASWSSASKASCERCNSEIVCSLSLLASADCAASARQLAARTSAPSARPACSAKACFHSSNSPSLEAKLFCASSSSISTTLCARRNSEIVCSFSVRAFEACATSARNSSTSRTKVSALACSASCDMPFAPSTSRRCTRIASSFCSKEARSISKVVRLSSRCAAASAPTSAIVAAFVRNSSSSRAKLSARSVSCDALAARSASMRRLRASSSSVCKAARSTSKAARSSPSRTAVSDAASIACAAFERNSSISVAKFSTLSVLCDVHAASSDSTIRKPRAASSSSCKEARSTEKAKRSSSRRAVVSDPALTACAAFSRNASIS
mmetsp:Transcript_50472/g.114683  ORF Transcript_50472/g.114683 Transcript_50472/m.114683 type:complete len:379 (+) Transcript_50472:1101-2237(+)